MKCGHPLCERESDRRQRGPHAPRYCREHRKRKWVLWRYRHAPAPPFPIPREPAPRTHLDVLIDLREQLGAIFAKWDERLKA